MCCTRDVPGVAPGVATVRSCGVVFVVCVADHIQQKFCEGVAEVLSMPYYTLTAHELSPSVVSALLNMTGVPASAVALYVLRGLMQYSPQVKFYVYRC
jgi:hypothetical protein